MVNRNQARPVDKSNAFLAKEENEDDLEEVSAAGAGHVGQPNKEKEEVVKMQSREKLVNELNVGKTISKMLDIQKRG